MPKRKQKFSKQNKNNLKSYFRQFTYRVENDKMYSSAPENMMDRYGKYGTEAEEVYASNEQV
ncbi:MAG: hypothetical protein HDR26_08350 [Lachnospiraceae bacterium]|nr:hypothetical protein [Lachnospiraceae bacterium]